MKVPSLTQEAGLENMVITFFCPDSGYSFPLFSPTSPFYVSRSKNITTEIQDRKAEIPLIVFRNAIKSIPNSIDFRMTFVETARQYPSVKFSTDEVYERYPSHSVPIKVLMEKEKGGAREMISPNVLHYYSLARDFPASPKAVGILCSRHFWETVYVTMDPSDLQDAFQQSYVAFEEALKVYFHMANSFDNKNKEGTEH